MEYLTARKFSFTSSGLPEDTFGVVNFTGTEGISLCYQFDVTLVSENLEIDLAGVVQQPGKLTFHRKDGSVVDYHGLILRFEQLHEIGGVAFYRACLAPKLHCLSLTRHNQVFLGRTVEEVVTECLKDGGLTSLDFEFRLQESYDPLDYACQYGESHLNFVSRRLEHEGIYYFFEQTDQGEKVVFTDTLVAHTSMPQGDTIYYSPPSGLEGAHTEEIIKTFSCKYSLTPAKVMLKDYNYMKPSLDVTGTAPVDDKGRGQVYSYGEHIKTPEQGNRLAKIMAESLLCRREVFEGEGSVPYMSPGFTFTLEDHYRKSFNQTYLTTEVTHEGNQAGYLLAGLTGGGAEDSEKVYYRNFFHSIPSSVQFRPERKSEKPRISGIVPAKIDAAGSGQYAEVDENGRYKVILPFDMSGRKDGKASKWIRMASPYAGSNHGMHLPLHKGTEVLITFMDGDADRPVIVGAVPNPETPSRVTTDNQTMSVIHTAGGNKVSIEDKTGSERILLHSPNQGSYVRIGAPNDPPAAGSGDPPTNEELQEEIDELKEDTSEAGIHLSTPYNLNLEAGTSNEVIAGASTEWVGGIESCTTLGATFYTYIGNLMETAAILSEEFSPTIWSYSETETKLHGLKTDLTATKQELTNVKNQVVDERNAIMAVGLALHDVDTRITDVKAEVTQDYTQAIANRTAAMATHAEVAAAKDQAIATSNKALGEAVTAVGNDVKTLGAEVKAIGEATATIGSKVQVLGDEVKTAGEVAETAAEIATVAALISMM
jgi:type VI secretion system secreted protein VgrG